MVSALGGVVLTAWLIVSGIEGDKHLPIGITGKDGVVTFDLEVADTEAGRANGLMFRKSLSSNKGMIFVYENEGNHSFWMRNTYIPLDMIFVGVDKKIVGILENVPILNEAPRSVGRPSKYVIELPAGTCREFGITEGAEVVFDDLELKRVGQV
jgi:uncharacterized membrane protein (UPF0127 family)